MAGASNAVSRTGAAGFGAPGAAVGADVPDGAGRVEALASMPGAGAVARVGSSTLVRAWAVAADLAGDASPDLTGPAVSRSGAAGFGAAGAAVGADGLGVSALDDVEAFASMLGAGAGAGSSIVVRACAAGADLVGDASPDLAGCRGDAASERRASALGMAVVTIGGAAGLVPGGAVSGRAASAGGAVEATGGTGRVSFSTGATMCGGSRGETTPGGSVGS